MRSPWKKYCQTVPRSRKTVALSTWWSSTAPSSVPTNVPRPPSRLVPPSTTAVMLRQRVADALRRVADAELARAASSAPRNTNSERGDVAEHDGPVHAHADAARGLLVGARPPAAASPQRRRRRSDSMTTRHDDQDDERRPGPARPRR